MKSGMSLFFLSIVHAQLYVLISTSVNSQSIGRHMKQHGVEKPTLMDDLLALKK